MIVRIAGRINVNGQWWDIETEHSVPDDTPSKLKVEMVSKIIKGISATGQIVSRVGAVKSPYGQKNNKQEPVEQNGTQSAAFTWPLPYCELHSEAMTLSKVQKDPSKVSFYCPQRHGQDYCKHRAKVDNTNGVPSFFEVK